MAASNECGDRTLTAGSFYGKIQRNCEQRGAIFTELEHAAARKLPKHAHELPFFALLLRGYYGEQYGRYHKQFGPFTVMFRPAGVPHQDEIGPQGLRFFEIELKPRWLATVAECSGNLSLPFDDERGGEVLWLVIKLYRETVGYPSPDALSVESLLAELVAQAARLPHEEKRQPPLWLRRVRDKIQAEHCDRLTLADLSREVQVHPVHLSRTFRHFAGQGIGEYVQRLRIRTACERLLSPGVTLADVSFGTGFADQSHFSRIFRRVTGITPNAFRNSLGLPVWHRTALQSSGTVRPS